MPPDSPEEAKRSLEQARLDLDERRFAYEQQVGQLRLELEKAKLKFDSRFAARYLGTFITGLVSLAAVIVTIAQVRIAVSMKEKDIAVAKVTERMQMEMTEAQQTREWNMKTAEFVATHWKLISDPQTQREMADIMLVVFPPKIANPLFRRLNSASAGDTAPWNEAEKISAAALLSSIESPDQPG